MHQIIFRLSGLMASLLLWHSVSTAQNASRYWTWGVGNTPGAVEFDPANNFQASGTWISLPVAPARSTFSVEGLSVVTDPASGNLLFYTDGDRVYDPSHTLLNPFNLLGGNRSNTQPSLVVQVPNCPLDSFYIFSNPAGTWSGPAAVGPITYRKFVPSTNTFVPPLGSPPSQMPNAASLPPMGEGMIAFPHAFLPDVFWLITNDATLGQQHVFRIDPSGLSYHAAFTLGTLSGPFGGIHDYAHIDSSFRDPDYAEIAFNRRDPFVVQVWNCLFDAVTGNFATSSFNVVANGAGGILLYNEWSPSGRFLYYSTYLNNQIYQYDLQNNSTTAVFPSITGARGGGLRMGPDGNLYFIEVATVNPTNPGLTRLAVVTTPDLAVSASGFSYQQNLFSYPNCFGYNLPSPALFVDTVICGPVLPVHVVDLQASVAAPGEIRLSWQGMDEEQAVAYEVQRSQYGDFKAIGQRKASGAGDRIYTWVDTVVHSRSNLYRLRLIGRDGKMGYSEVVEVDAGELPAVWNARYEAGTRILHLERRGDAGNEPVRLVLLDVAGRRIWERRPEPGQTSLMADMGKVAPGVYFFCAIRGGSRDTQRLLIR